MKVVNISQNTVLGDKIELADSFFKRFLGLIPKKSLGNSKGLIIRPCNSIHMFFMRFSIDVIFVDKNNTVVYLMKELKPWKISKIIWNAKYVIELPVGTLSESKTQIGDKIEIV